MSDINELIIAHLHNEATTQEVEQLFDWVREDPQNAQEFARYALMHSQVLGQLQGEQLATKVQADASAVVPSGQGNSRSRLPAVIALAAVAVVVLGFIAWFGRPQATPKEFLATIEHAVDAEWNGPHTLAAGDRAASGMLDLRSGFVRMRLDNGVVLTLQAPAQLELVSVGKARLTTGLLTAIVPQGAEGFCVDTPTGEIIDLGTAFGVQLDSDSEPRITVFEGAVDVTARNSVEKHHLEEGQAAVMAADEVRPVDFDLSRFERVWPVASGVLGSSGAFRFTPPWPRRLKFVQSDEHIFLAPEGRMTRLESPLQTNISQPGIYSQKESLTPGEIPAGALVRSFILHFHPAHERTSVTSQRIGGSLTFDRPILGIIVSHSELSASADTFRGRRAGESLEHRQLELTGARGGDVIELSDDRHTLSLDLFAQGRFSDLVRVIVDASPRPHPD